MADPITREHLEWLREIAFDPRVGGASTKGAIALTRYFNRQTGDTFVSLETLGNALGVSARQAARMIDELESTGHLNAERIGKRKPNRYSPRRLADSGDASVPGHKTSAHQDPVTGRFMSAHKPEVCGHFEAKCTDTKRPANPSIDPGRERSSPYGLSLSRQRARVFREGFTRFWWTYPRRVAQADARRPSKRR